MCVCFESNGVVPFACAVSQRASAANFPPAGAPLVQPGGGGPPPTEARPRAAAENSCERRRRVR